ISYVFFFQAEAGIRDRNVTGVQTCALPIFDAFVLATGNDWRAVEAGVHAYAARDGQYRGLAKWTYHSDREILSGELTLPLALGAVGGSIGIHPTVQVTKSILGQSDAKHLMEIAVSLGLAQNFAA